MKQQYEDEKMNNQLPEAIPPQKMEMSKESAQAISNITSDLVARTLDDIASGKLKLGNEGIFSFLKLFKHMGKIFDENKIEYQKILTQNTSQQKELSDGKDNTEERAV
jgi:hypothetical protein